MHLRASVRVRPTVQEFDLFLNYFKGRTSFFDLCSATPMTPRQPGAWPKYSPLSYSLNELVFLHEFVWVRRRILFTTTRAKRARILFGPLPAFHAIPGRGGAVGSFLRPTDISSTNGSLSDGCNERHSLSKWRGEERRHGG